MKFFSSLLFFCFTFLSLFFILSKEIKAVCVGGTRTQGSVVADWACNGGPHGGQECSSNSFCREFGGNWICEHSQYCQSETTVACSSMTTQAGCLGLNDRGDTECFVSGNCSWQTGGGGPTPTPSPGATPGPQPNTCSGDCFSGIANCGVVGRTGGSGSCPNGGELCCAAPNQPRSCNFGLTPNPVIVNVNQIWHIDPTNIGVTGGGVINFFAYSAVGGAAGRVSISPNPRNWYCRDVNGRLRCGGPQDGQGWGTNVRGLSTTNGMITNGLAIQCGVVDHGVTTRYFNLQVNPAPTPTPAPGWWQSVNGDVVAGGDIVSRVPAGALRFNNVGLGGYPGIAQYVTDYDFTADAAGRGSPSTLGWLANSSALGRGYDANFFGGFISTSNVYNNLSGTVAGTTFDSGGNVSPDGYFWYRSTGDLTINGPVTIGATRKVVLLVEGGNLTINGNVVVSTPGQGFFMASVGRDSTSGTGGNLSVAGTVTTLNGIFLVDGTTTTGTGTVQLALSGALRSNGGVTLQRDLGALNATTPAEQFTFDPRLIMLLPKSFGVQKIVWKEIAP